MDWAEALDLNQKQYAMYMYLLENGPKSASQLAAGLGEQRTNSYLIADELLEKGLVDKDETQPVLRFVATNPAVLKRLLSQKQRRLAEQSALLAKHLPELEGLYQLNTASEGMAYFEGLKGYTAALDDMVNSRREVCVFGSSDITTNCPDAKEVLNKKFQQRALAKCSTRLLFDESLRGQRDVPAAQSETTKRYSQVRYWGETPFGNGEVAVYGSTIVLTSYDDTLISLVLKNPALAGILQAIFDSAWRSATIT